MLQLNTLLRPSWPQHETSLRRRSVRRQLAARPVYMKASAAQPGLQVGEQRFRGLLGYEVAARKRMPFGAFSLLLPRGEHVEQRVHLAELAPDCQDRAGDPPVEVASIVLEVTRRGGPVILQSGADRPRQCVCGNPCSSTTGVPLPPSQVLRRMPLARTARCSMPVMK
jgi:hypothetical protein